jgi:hypothetical protein
MKQHLGRVMFCVVDQEYANSLCLSILPGHCDICGRRLKRSITALRPSTSFSRPTAVNEQAFEGIITC